MRQAAMHCLSQVPDRQYENVSEIFLGISIVKDIQFDQQCARFLKQAADASSVELAERQQVMKIKFVFMENYFYFYKAIKRKVKHPLIAFAILKELRYHEPTS